MIAKIWNGSAFVEHYEKTVANKLFTNDGLTNLFDENTKLKLPYLPDAVFDSLLYFGAVTGGATSGVAESIGQHFVTISGGITGRSLVGVYVVSTNSGWFKEDAAAVNYSGVYVQGLWKDPTMDTQVLLDAQDWFAIDSYSGSGTIGDPYIVEFAIINNKYEAASDTRAGVVKFGAAGSVTIGGKVYAVQNDGAGGMAVSVPWADHPTYTPTAGIDTRVLNDSVEITGMTSYSNGHANTEFRINLVAGSNMSLSKTADGNLTFNATNTTYDLMTSSVLGLGKLASDTAQSVAANAVSAVASRTYGIQKNASGQLVVNVPWTDNNTWVANSAANAGYVSAGSGNANKVWKTDGSGNPAWRDDTDTVFTLDLAANGTRGGIQVGYVENGKNYPVELSSEKAFVNVPWTDTTYSAASGKGLTLDGNAFRMTYPLFVQTTTPTTDVVGAIWFDIN